MPIHPAWDEVGRSKAGLGALSAQHSHFFKNINQKVLVVIMTFAKGFPTSIMMRTTLLRLMVAFKVATA